MQGCKDALVEGCRAHVEGCRCPVVGGKRPLAAAPQLPGGGGSAAVAARVQCTVAALELPLRAPRSKVAAVSAGAGRQEPPQQQPTAGKEGAYTTRNKPHDRKLKLGKGGRRWEV